MRTETKRRFSHHLFVKLSTELLSRGYCVRLRVKGKSMYPTIRDGERITVKPVSPPEVRRGDIVLYRSKRRLPTNCSTQSVDPVFPAQSQSGAAGVIVHRVVSIKKHSSNPSSLRPRYSFRLRGDASATCDEPVDSRQVFGRIVSVERDGRSIDLVSRVAMTRHRVRLLISRAKQALARCGDHFCIDHEDIDGKTTTHTRDQSH